MRLAMKTDKLSEDKIVQLIKKFENSAIRELMLKGDKYYRVENDIMEKSQSRVVDGKRIDEAYKANNKIAHAKYKTQVDEKIGYLLTR